MTGSLFAHAAPASPDARDVLRLIRSENVGPVTYHQLVGYYGSAARALDALPELSRRGGRKKAVRICPVDEAEAELERIEAYGARVLMHGDADYPALLARIHDAPPLLCIKGSSSVWQKRTLVGLVGARNASANGCAFARKIASDLGAQGYGLASGLARGIDTAAHHGSLSSGTVAVIAGGIDNIYPPENAKLYADIAEQGCIIAEAPFGTAPIARHFPARNRIIAGMSAGVVVVEASLKSGSLITAHYALDYGRDVFAVPGSPLDPRCKGSNDLIRNGAVLTESVDDVLQNLQPVSSQQMQEQDRLHFAPPPASAPTESELNLNRTIILEKLSPEPVLLDELLAQCHISPTSLYTILLELELAGRLNRHAGGKVSLNMKTE